jgi:RNA-directed DNA polymerase
MRAKKLRGVGWQRWSENFLYEKLGLYSNYQIRYYTGWVLLVN